MVETDAGFRVLSRYKRRRQEQNTLELRNDVDRYLSDPCEELNDQFDLTGWKLNGVKYQILSKLLKMFLLFWCLLWLLNLHSVLEEAFWILLGVPYHLKQWKLCFVHKIRSVAKQPYWIFVESLKKWKFMKNLRTVSL